MCLRRVIRRDKSPKLLWKAAWSSKGHDSSRWLTLKEVRGAVFVSKVIPEETLLILIDSKRLILIHIALTLT